MRARGDVEVDVAEHRARAARGAAGRRRRRSSESALAGATWTAPKSSAFVVAQRHAAQLARGRCRRAAAARRAARGCAARGRAPGRCARPRRSRAGRGRASCRASASGRSACSGRGRTALNCAEREVRSGSRGCRRSAAPRRGRAGAGSRSAGCNFASRRVATIDWSKTRATRVAEALELLRLAREGLHDAHAGDVLLGVRGQLARSAAGPPGSRGGRCARSAGRSTPRTGTGAIAISPSVGVDARSSRRPRAASVSDRLQDEHEPVAEEEAHGLQIDGRARHQLAGLLAVEEAQLQALQVAVEQLAQVVLDRRARCARRSCAACR